jgi:hypothetical protein
VDADALALYLLREFRRQRAHWGGVLFDDVGLTDGFSLLDVGAMYARMLGAPSAVAKVPI